MVLLPLVSSPCPLNAVRRKRQRSDTRQLKDYDMSSYQSLQLRSGYHRPEQHKQAGSNILHNFLTACAEFLQKSLISSSFQIQIPSLSNVFRY